MTAAEIRALIALNLADNSSITALEHRAVENELINYAEATNSQLGVLSASFLSKLPKNVGYISGLNISTSSTLTVSGNVVSAVINDAPNTIITITVQNAMPSMNYIVKSYVESMGNLDVDNVAGSVVFKKINTTSFQISVTEYENVTQNLKIHLEVISLD